MADNFYDLTAAGAQDIRMLSECNALTGRYGLSLTKQQLRALEARCREAILSAGRIEFGGGVIRAIIEEFCDSPYISQDNYEETISELLDAFYYFKNESEDRISDDELIKTMHRHFDTTCQGSLEYLSGTTLEDLCRNCRYDGETDDRDRYGRPV